MCPTDHISGILLQVFLLHNFLHNFAIPLNLVLPVSKALIDLVRIDICTSGPSEVNPSADAVHFDILFDGKFGPCMPRSCG